MNGGRRHRIVAGLAGGQATVALLCGLLVAGATAAVAADDERSGPAVRVPGDPPSARTRLLDAGAAVLQDKPPIDALNAYLDGFHFYSGNPEAQMEAHHFCSVVNDEVIQCVIYDGNARSARLMGVEYIVSRQLFESLPAGEKALWHSHVHEVKSGQLVAPGIPSVAEQALMEQLVGTYGKTWHTWHTDLQKELPLGVPQLMMGFTADGQIDQRMLEARDRRLGIDSTRTRQRREEITAPPVAAGADAWQAGDAIQLADPTGPGHRAVHDHKAGERSNGRGRHGVGN